MQDTHLKAKMDSESGPECDGYRPSRSHSVSTAHGHRDHTPSLATAAHSISCTDLRGSGRAARAAPALCPRHLPPHVCNRRQCDELHLCRLYLDGFCPREDAACRWGHEVKSAYNWDALEAYQLQTVPEHELLWLTRSLMRHTAPVSAEEYRRELALCEKFSADACCGRRDCFKIHVCPHLVAGKCQAGARCRWTHRLDNPDNVIVLLRLRCADLTEGEVLARLARLPDDEQGTVSSPSSGVGSLARLARRPDDGQGTVSSPSSGVGSQRTAASSVTVSEDVAGSSQRGDASWDGEENIETPRAPTSDCDHVTCTSASGSNSQSGAAPLKSAVKSQTGRSSTDGASVITSLDLCLQNVNPSVCTDHSCTRLHMCRLFVAGMCPYGEKCSSGHEPCTSAHNSHVLKRHMLLGVSETDLLKGLREGYLTRNPILVEERHMVLQACRPYQTGSCRQSDCPRLHICLKHARGTCKGGDECGLSHQMDAPAQAEIVRRIGLDTLQVEELFDILTNPVFSKDVLRALASGSAELALDGRDTPFQTEMQPCAPLLSGASVSLPAPSDHSGPRREAGLQTSGCTLEQGSASGENTPPTSVDRSSVDAIRSVATSLDLCHRNIRPAVCLDEFCQNLHLCRFFVAGVCPYDKKCGRGHKPCTSKHNKGVLKRHGITGISEEDLLKNLRSGYLSRNPLTDSERHFALQVCRPYQEGSCKTENCLRLHICTEYVMDTCSRKCGLSHQINSPSHAVIIRRLGLSSLRVKDILEILQDSGSVKVVNCDSSLQKNPVPSGSAVIADQSKNHDECTAHDSTQKEPCSSRVGATQCSAQGVSDSAGRESESPQAATVTSGGQSSMLCDVHSSGGRCDRGDCNDFHVCGYYLANVCQRSDESCALGHTFQTNHNVRVIQIRGLLGCSADDFQTLLDEITLQARITFKNHAHKKVNMCIPYSSPGGCTRADGCRQFHVCHRFLGGSCDKSDCGLLHSLADDHNQRVRAALGLAAADCGEDQDVIWATDKDLIELLRAKMSLKPGVYPTEQSETFHSVTFDDSHGVRTTRTACGDRAAVCSTPEQSVPAVCQQYGTTAGCSDANCTSVHICPHFLAGSCRKRRSRPCTLEHRLSSLHNREVLSQAGRMVSDENHKELVKMLYDSSPHVRRTEVYDKLRLCSPHNATGCKASDCMSIHICQKFVVGSCKKTQKCAKGHAIEGTDTIRKLPFLGLDDASADEVLEMLRAINGGPSVSPDALYPNECAPASEDSVAKLDPLTPSISLTVNAALPASAGTTTAEASACGSAAVNGTLWAVCQQYGSIQGCSDADCAAVHICPHFLAASCRRSDCSLGHLLTTAHNREALRRRGRMVNELNHDAIVKILYDTSPHIRRTELYEKLRLCHQHGTTDGCKLCNCLKIHLCHSYLAGACNLETCEKGHRLEIYWNKTKLLVNGLEDASAVEVLEMLRAVHGCRSVCGGSPAAAGTSSSPPSGSAGVMATLPSSVCPAAGQSVPVVCQQYGTTAGCSDANCASVHICPHFLAGSCRRREHCELGHRLISQHNRQVLRQAGQEATTEMGHADLIQAMYATSPHIRRTEAYTKLRVCVRYNTKGLGCQKETCELIHICSPFVAGTCKEEACRKDHHIQSTENKTRLGRMGLRTASSEEVLEMLRAVHAWRSMCGRPLASTGTSPSPSDDSACVRATTPLSGNSAAEQSVPPVCQKYGTIAGCSDANCASVHICSHFLAGACRRSEHCQLEHQLSSQHNRKVLRQAGHEPPTEKDHLIKAMYFASSHIPRAEVYKKLRVCDRHITKRMGCQVDTCGFIHVCSHFVCGTCTREDCGKGHEVETTWNKTKLGAMGLEDASSEEVLEMLRAVHDWRSVCTQ